MRRMSNKASPFELVATSINRKMGVFSYRKDLAVMKIQRIVLSFAFTISLIAFIFFSFLNTQAANRSTQTDQPIETNILGTNQLPLIAPAVVLVGLKEGVLVGLGLHGAETTDFNLNKAFTRFGVLKSN